MAPPASAHSSLGWSTPTPPWPGGPKSGGRRPAGESILGLTSASCGLGSPAIHQRHPRGAALTSAVSRCPARSRAFTNRWGEPLYPDTVTALMSKLISQHNKSVPATAQVLPHARLHGLRHLHATTLLLAGVPVHVVAARLGRADPAVTLRVYSHVLHEHARGVGDIFAQAVEAAVSKSVSKPGQQR